MTMHKQSARGWARKCYMAFPGKIARIFAAQVFVRLLALAPLLLLWQPGALALGALLTPVLYLLAVFPMRFYACADMTKLLGGEGGMRYGAALRAALVRAGRGFLYALPFAVSLGLLYYGYKIADFPTFFGALKWLGALAGGDYQTGVIISAAVLVLTGILFAWGWQRGMTLDFQPVSRQSLKASLAGTRRMRRAHKGAIFACALKNGLWCLPALAAAAAVLGLGVFDAIPQSGDMFMMAQNLLDILFTGFPLKINLLLAAVFVLLYLPVLPYRKLCNASLMLSLGATEPADEQA